MKRLAILGALGAAALLTACAEGFNYDTTPLQQKPYKEGTKSIVFVVDTSGSMDDKLDGVRKIDSAKRAMNNMLEYCKTHDDKHNDLEAGLVRFRYSTPETVIPLEDFNYNSMVSEVQNLIANSNTPLGRSLAVAERDLDSHATGRKYVVLLTDGMNNSGREPDEVFRSIQETNAREGDFPTQLYVVAFDTDRENFAPLQSLGATIFGANQEEELTKVL